MMKHIGLVVAAEFAVSSLFGAVTISSGSTSLGFARPSGFPKSLSGITYAGGETYYVVADDNSTSEVGLYRVAITPNGSSKWTSATIGERIPLATATDLEAIAYDPATGSIWAANETTTKTINEYDPQTGAVLSRLTLPPVMLKDRNNYGFESLTISGDGLTMWTANEESLTVDGPRSAYGVASTNRLVKFTRPAPGKPWQLAAMYPYVTDTWHNRYNLGGSGRRGISDLCALPDGSLLVLERELSSPTDGSDFWAKVDADFYIAIYRITPEAMAAATDVKDFDGLAHGGWTKIAKGNSLVDTGAQGIKNWEGFCLGQRLPDGTCFMPMVTDAGDGNTAASMACLTLAGLDICTLDFPAPTSGDTPSIVGSNYRYLNGTGVTVGLTGEGLTPSPYTNNNARVATASWRLATSGRSGTGTTAAFTVSGDDTLFWSVESSTAVTPIVSCDTFEGVDAGTASQALAGWSANGTVVAATYTAPVVGTPMQKATHEQVLSVYDSISRDYASTNEKRQQLDLMVKVVRPSEDDMVDTSAHQCGVAVFADGRFRVFHADASGAATVSVASETVYAEGDWVRVTMTFDYTQAQPMFTLRLNGAFCGTYPCVGRKTCVAGFDVVSDTALDDVILTHGEPNAEVAADPAHPSTAPAGLVVPQIWFDRNGLALGTDELDADGDGLKAWQEYLAGTSPQDATSVFAIADFKVEGNAVAITFTGDLPRPDLLAVTWCAELGGAQTTVSGTITKEGDVSVWRATVPPAARFFRAFLGQ